MQSKALRFFLAILVLLFLLTAAWTWLTLHWSYSEGDRAGYVQKLSKKGWLCKTWEGEIAMVTMPGAIPDKFEFPVRDDALAKQINELAGKRVVLFYQQHKFIPSSCFGETEYFIQSVREMVDTPAPVQAPSPASMPAPSVNQGRLLAPR